MITASWGQNELNDFKRITFHTTHVSNQRWRKHQQNKKDIHNLHKLCEENSSQPVICQYGKIVSNTNTIRRIKMYFIYLYLWIMEN